MKYRIEVELGRSSSFGQFMTWTRSDYQTAMEQIRRHVDDVRYVTLHEIGDDDELVHIIREHGELSEEVVELRDEIERRGREIDALRSALSGFANIAEYRELVDGMVSVLRPHERDGMRASFEAARIAVNAPRATGETENEERGS